MALMAACLTRWAGISLVLTSMAGIYLFKKENFKTRFIQAAVLAGASFLPLTLWMARNALLTGRSIDREISFHPHHLFFSGMGHLILIAFMFYMGISIWSKRVKRDMAKIPEGVVILIGVLFYFCLIYLIMTLLTMIFFDAATKLGDRIFLPLDIAGILLAGLCIHILLELNKKPGTLKPVIIILCLFVGGVNGFQATQWALHRYYNGVGLDSIRWDHSTMIAEIKKIPSEKIVYSNAPAALYFFLNRDAVMLIAKVNRLTRRPDPQYPVFVSTMKDDLSLHKAFLVYFDPDKEWVRQLKDYKSEIPLKTIVSLPDGAIYVWDDK